MNTLRMIGAMWQDKIVTHWIAFYVCCRVRWNLERMNTIMYLLAGTWYRDREGRVASINDVLGAKSTAKRYKP